MTVKLCKIPNGNLPVRRRLQLHPSSKKKSLNYVLASSFSNNCLNVPYRWV